MKTLLDVQREQQDHQRDGASLLGGKDGKVGNVQPGEENNMGC